jgi:hypothetical protein
MSYSSLSSKKCPTLEFSRADFRRHPTTRTQKGKAAKPFGSLTAFSSHNFHREARIECPHHIRR